MRTFNPFIGEKHNTIACQKIVDTFPLVYLEKKTRLHDCVQKDNENPDQFGGEESRARITLADMLNLKLMR